jgi:hypothetical protein
MAFHPKLKPWRPGQSGNPSGLARGLTMQLPTLIRRTSGKGRELVAFYFAVLRGEVIPIPDLPREKWRRPKLEHRMAAAAWLADRGWGKAKEIIELLDERPEVNRRALVAHLSVEDRATLERLIDLALARAAQASAGLVIDMPAASMLPEAQDAPDADPA